MHPLWTSARRIEYYLTGQLSAVQNRYFLAKLRRTPRLRKQVAMQQYLYRLIRLTGRRQLKRDLRRLHDHMLHHPSEIDLQRQMEEIFGK